MLAGYDTVETDWIEKILQKDAQELNLKNVRVLYIINHIHRKTRGGIVMTYTAITKCDGPCCKKQYDETMWDAPTYHHFKIGGSDFEMSFSNQLEFDFCCIDCLEKFLKEFKEEK